MTTQAALVEADRGRLRAMMNADTPGLGEVLDDDLRWVHASGVVDSKPTLLASIDSGRLDYQSITPFDEQVRLYDGIGLITGCISLSVVVDHVPREVQNLFTSVWRPTSGGWLLVNWQTTRVAVVAVTTPGRDLDPQTERSKTSLTGRPHR